MARRLKFLTVWLFWEPEEWLTDKSTRFFVLYVGANVFVIFWVLFMALTLPRIGFSAEWTEGLQLYPIGLLAFLSVYKFLQVKKRLSLSWGNVPLVLVGLASGLCLLSFLSNLLGY